MAATSLDKFTNMATITVTETAANTLTYKKLETGISLTEKVAWLIARIEYYYTGNFSDFNAANDALHCGLCVANTRASQTTADSYTDSTLLDKMELIRSDYGAAASAQILDRPVYKDWSTIPGGGILVPPVPLYGFAQGVSLAAATTVIIKLFYTLITLQPADYWELVEARRIISS